MEAGFTFCSSKYCIFLGKTLRGKGGGGRKCIIYRALLVTSPRVFRLKTEA